MRAAFLLFFCLIFCSQLFCQTDSSHVTADSIARAKLLQKKLYERPRRAALMSAILPGLGQAYNGKYWKIPIVYAALGGAGYIFYTNNQNYNLYRNALRDAVADSTNVAEIDGFEYTTQQLQTQKTNYKKYRDIGIIAMIVVYAFNILDATVDAHLRTFDVSDDLGFQLRPTFDLYPSMGKVDYSAGLRCRLVFK